MSNSLVNGHKNCNAAHYHQERINLNLLTFDLHKKACNHLIVEGILWRY